MKVPAYHLPRVQWLSAFMYFSFPRHCQSGFCKLMDQAFRSLFASEICHLTACLDHRMQPQGKSRSPSAPPPQWFFHLSGRDTQGAQTLSQLLEYWWELHVCYQHKCCQEETKCQTEVCRSHHKYASERFPSGTVALDFDKKLGLPCRQCLETDPLGSLSNFTVT